MNAVKYMLGAVLAAALAVPAVVQAEEEPIVVTAQIGHVSIAYLSMISGGGGSSGGGDGGDTQVWSVPLADPIQDPKTAEEMQKEIEANQEIVVTATPPMYLPGGYVAYYSHGVYAIYDNGLLAWLFGEEFLGNFVPDPNGEMTFQGPTVTPSVEYKDVKAAVEYQVNVVEKWRRVDSGGGTGIEPPMPEGEEPPR